nr:MAG TPA: hypothetical protein [Bacteriophage sp.]
MRYECRNNFTPLTTFQQKGSDPHFAKRTTKRTKEPPVEPKAFSPSTVS